MAMQIQPGYHVTLGSLRLENVKPLGNLRAHRVADKIIPGISTEQIPSREIPRLEPAVFDQPRIHGHRRHQDRHRLSGDRDALAKAISQPDWQRLLRSIAYSRSAWYQPGH